MSKTRTAVIATFGTIAPTLAANGYEPVPIIRGEKRPSAEAWQAGGFAERAREFSRDYTGILTADTPCIDIDVSDAALVAECERIVFDVLNCFEAPPPERVGMAPRAALLFRCAKRSRN